MSAKQRALAASAAILGVGGSLVTFPAPASAHRTVLRIADATAEVSVGHRELYACHLGTQTGNAVVDWRERGDSTAHSLVYSTGCARQTTNQDIIRYRLCVNTSRCTAWKSH